MALPTSGKKRCRTAPGSPCPGRRQCQGRSPRHAFGAAPFLSPRRPASARQLCGSLLPWVVSEPRQLARHVPARTALQVAPAHRRLPFHRGRLQPRRGWLRFSSQLFGREAALQMPLDFLHSFLPIRNKTAAPALSQGKARR